MLSNSRIYLDYNSTTPVDADVLETMLPWFIKNFGNAASFSHQSGRLAAEAVESARDSLAAFIGASPSEIIFTSGSTESINLAIKGVAEAYHSKGNHIITWQTEHRAVLDTCKNLEERGFRLTYLPVDREGMPDLNELEKTISGSTVLVAMMMVNNETGVIMPVKEAATIAHTHGALFFTDATQAAGKMQIDVNDCGADLMAVSAHKMYGPKGTGLLYVRRKNPRVQLIPLMHGGGHEKSLRPGTMNVPGIIGMQKAAEISKIRYWDDSSSISKMRTALEQMLTDDGFGFINGNTRNRIYNTTNIAFPGIKASTLISRLPEIELSTGSACSSAIPEPSHVLKAMGCSDELAYASVRLSLGRWNTMDEILSAGEKIRSAVDQIRKENKVSITI
jgi:cysteine desulfurase